MSAPKCNHPDCTKPAHFIALILQGGSFYQVDVCVEHFASRLPSICKIGEYVGLPWETPEVLKKKAEFAESFMQLMTKTFAMRWLDQKGDTVAVGYRHYGGMVFNSIEPDSRNWDRNNPGFEAFVTCWEVKVSVCPRSVSVSPVANIRCRDIKDLTAHHLGEVPKSRIQKMSDLWEDVIKGAMSEWADQISEDLGE